MAAGEEVPAVAEGEVVVAEPVAAEEAAYSWGKSVAAVAGAVPAAAAAEEEAKQAPVALAEGVELHSLPAVAVEFLRLVAADAAEEDLAVGVVAGVAAGAVDLRRKGFGFHRDPSLGRHGLSKWLCEVPSISQEVEAFPSFPSCVEQTSSLVHQHWQRYSCRGLPFWEVRFERFRHRCYHLRRR